MMRAPSKYRVPYLREKVIEEHADMLLGEWALDHPAITEPPVPIEDILELGLKLDFEIEDLRSALGHDDVLGAIWFGAHLVKVAGVGSIGSGQSSSQRPAKLLSVRSEGRLPQVLCQLVSRSEPILRESS